MKYCETEVRKVGLLDIGREPTAEVLAALVHNMIDSANEK